MNNKLKNKIIIIVILLLIFFGLYLLLNRNNKDEKVMNVNTISDETMTPENVLAQMEESSSLGDKVEMLIISPEEEVFMPRQARMWEARLNNIEKGAHGKAVCHWQFYLNENNEEVLYKEMENSSGVSSDNPDLCAFTSTFIENRGKLRVKLDVVIKNMYGDILGEYSAEKKYSVE